MKTVTIEMTEDLRLEGHVVGKGYRANAQLVKEGNGWFYRVLSAGSLKGWLLSTNCVKEVSINSINHGRRKIKIRPQPEIEHD